jgi:hypothetical protein
MPLRWLNAFITMLPRLRAEQSIRRVTELQLGTRQLTDESASEIWEAWQNAANPDKEDEEVSDFWV